MYYYDYYLSRIQESIVYHVHLLEPSKIETQNRRLVYSINYALPQYSCFCDCMIKKKVRVLYLQSQNDQSSDELHTYQTNASLT